MIPHDALMDLADSLRDTPSEQLHPGFILRHEQLVNASRLLCDTLETILQIHEIQAPPSPALVEAIRVVRQSMGLR